MAITLSQGYDPQRPAPAATTAESQWTTHPTTPVTAADTVAQQAAIRASAAYRSFHTAYILAQAAASSTSLNPNNMLSIATPAILYVGSENYVSSTLVCKAWRNRIINLPRGAMAFQVRPRPDVAEVFDLRAEGLPVSFTLAEIDIILSARLRSITRRRGNLETPTRVCIKISKEGHDIIAAYERLGETLPATDRAIYGFRHTILRDCVIA